MKDYMCQLVDSGKRLERVPDRDAFSTWFLFNLVPSDHFEKPDEMKYTEERQILVTIGGPALRSRHLPRELDEQIAVFYWYALDTLRIGQDELIIDFEFLEGNPVTVSGIPYPPSGSFPISVVQKMGF